MSDGNVGTASTEIAPVSEAPKELGSGLQETAKPAAEQIQKLSFGEVIRELMMMKTDLEYYRNVVSLGSARALRIAALEKAGMIVERAQREHTERRKLDRR